jgi:hypothetical protein
MSDVPFDTVSVKLRDHVRMQSQSRNFEDIMEYFAENFTEEMLDLIGADKCVEHFDLRLHRERCWKDGSDR